MRQWVEKAKPYKRSGKNKKKQHRKESNFMKKRRDFPPLGFMINKQFDAACCSTACFFR